MADEGKVQGFLSADRHLGQPSLPVLGGALQRRAGTARHDAVAWGYARGADARGVDIIQNCEVKGIRRDASGAAIGVETRGATSAPSASAWWRPATPRP